MIEKIDSVIELIDASIDNNNEQLIIDGMKELRQLYENDLIIIKEVISKVKYINNIFEIKRTDLTNRISELNFFSLTSATLNNLSQKIDYFISYNNSVVESINRSNNELATIITHSENEINNESSYIIL